MLRHPAIRSLASVLLWACAGGPTGTGGTLADGGGASAAGGTASTGGTAGAGGTSGGAGGVVTGGLVGSGGAGGTGVGGLTSTGGTVASGGTTSTGGAVSAGGTTATGGDTSSGGSTAASPGPSCAGMAGTECNGESCCAAIAMPAGTFPMGWQTEDCTNYPGGCTSGCPSGLTCGASEQPEHSATVSAFALDKYEVTVGRFRKFVAAYPGSRPAAGAGANPSIGSTTSWQSGWDASLPADQATLIANVSCHSTYQTWTDAAGANETKAINCVSWYEAFAFCIWDGGWLPTEAEWEYAAAGGSDNRLYPWGSAAPDCTLANMSGCGAAVKVAGNAPSGAGRWGHLDLAGNVYEWAFDWYSSNFYTSSAVTNVVNLTATSSRVMRCGSFFDGPASSLRSASRYYGTPAGHYSDIGLRCARTP